MSSLLLLSLGSSAVPDFLADRSEALSRPLRIGYVTDATRDYADAPFVQQEFERIAAYGHPLTRITLGELTPEQLPGALTGLDGVYVAGGNTFVLMDAMRRSGADLLLPDRVAVGLLYIGSSAGSIVAGPSLEPATLMDDVAAVPGFSDFRGLGLTDVVVVPHADGALPPYPRELIERTVAEFGDRFPLITLADSEALLVDMDVRRKISSV